MGSGISLLIFLAPFFFFVIVFTAYTYYRRFRRNEEIARFLANARPDRTPSVNNLMNNWDYIDELPSDDTENVCPICFGSLFLSRKSAVASEENKETTLSPDRAVNNDENIVINSDRQKSSASICVIDGPVVQLPCKHMYHEICIQQWALDKNHCPTCRYKPTQNRDALITCVVVSVDSVPVSNAQAVVALEEGRGPGHAPSQLVPAVDVDTISGVNPLTAPR